jgi:tetratricopeptide (TPR) repeat protein
MPATTGTTTSKQFSSEGFDLDALSQANEDVILELGGKVVPADDKTEQKEEEEDVMKEAERLKQVGNDHFKAREWHPAYALYTQAIAATPGSPTGPELLKLEEAWRDEQNKKMREEMRKQKEEKKETTTVQTFQPPKHPHGEKLAVYYCNRAATLMQLSQEEGEIVESTTKSKSSFYDDQDEEKLNAKNYPRLSAAIEDCSVAILLNESYGKAYLRRSTAYERMGDTESALRDAQQAQTLDPQNSAVRMAVARLTKIEHERIERLKTETISKLKDLGNTILGNFGLSLDNFNAVQDPKTGSYSISFNQGSGGGGNGNK